MQNLDELVSKVLVQIEAINEEQDLEPIRIEYLGKKGYFTELMKQLGTVSQEERPKNDFEEMLEKFKANTVLFEDEKRNKKRR